MIRTVLTAVRRVLERAEDALEQSRRRRELQTPSIPPAARVPFGQERRNWDEREVDGHWVHFFESTNPGEDPRWRLVVIERGGVAFSTPSVFLHVEDAELWLRQWFKGATDWPQAWGPEPAWRLESKRTP